MNDIILKLYFDDKLKQIEIAKTLNISKYKVSRVVSKDNRYINEKERRKAQNKIEHIENTKKYVKAVRSKNDVEYEKIKSQHIEAVRELSSNNRTISNKTYRDWNTSVFEYNHKTKSYHLCKEINAGADVPKRIRW